MKTRNSLVVLVLVLLSQPALALAIPGVPHQFYGTVTINGNPAPDGTTVEAMIDGRVVSTTTRDGKYGYDPIFYVDDPQNQYSGEPVTFRVAGVDTGVTVYFCNGCVTRVDFSVAISQPSQEEQDTGSGGSSGGGGAYVESSPSEEETPPTTSNNGTGEEESTIPGGDSGGQDSVQECQPRWVCTHWSGCSDGIQTRTCTDMNECGTTLGMPLTSQPCSSRERDEETFQGGVLGAVTGFFGAEASSGILYGLAGFVVLVGGALIARKRIYREKE